VRLLPAAIPEFPVFNAKFEPRRGGGDDPCGDPGKPAGASGAASAA